MKALIRLLFLHALSLALSLTFLYAVSEPRYIFILILFMPPLTLGIGRHYFKLDREAIQMPTNCLLLLLMTLTLTVHYLNNWFLPLNLASFMLYSIHIVKFYQKSIRKEIP